MYYENFQKLCEERGVKPGTVSRATGVSTATLTSWKQGKYTPKQDKLQKLADYFNVPLEEITKKEPVKISMPGFIQKYNENATMEIKKALSDVLMDAASKGIDTFMNSDERMPELVDLFLKLNDSGKDAIMKYLRFMASDPDNLKDTGSQNEKVM